MTEAVLTDHKYHLELQADHTVSAKNPVCELKVDPETTPHVAEHDDHTDYFCSVRCRTKFVAAPQNYVGDASRKQSDLTAETIYTYPMPPEIRTVRSGSCSICGMALELLLVSAAATPNVELIA